MIATMTRREQAEAYADLYDVPMVEVYRRYGAVLLPSRTPITHHSSPITGPKAEAQSGR